MSRRISLIALVIVTAMSQFAAGAVAPAPRPEGSRIYNGKSVYLPADLASNDFTVDKGYDVHGIIRRSSTDYRERITHLEGHPHFFNFC